MVVAPRETVVNSASPHRGRGKEICRANSGKRVGETEAFGVMFGGSLGSAGEVEMGSRRLRKLAERCVEMADAGS